MTKKSALSGITVLDLTRLLPGPYCSMILADHGARVIAVEDKRYISDGHFINMLYRNKEHMALDLKTQKGKEIFFKLVNKADIIMEGFRPGVTKRLGIDYETVSKINPKLIYCSITGYGQTGPYSKRAGHDANYLGVAGVLDLIGEKDKAPSIPGVQFADIAGGGINAALGILLALYAREKNGRGQYIDISMTDTAAAFLPVPMFFKQITGKAPERSDSMHAHRYACYNSYETKDKKYLTICAVEYKFWKTLCGLLNVPEYTALQYDEKRRNEIIGFMQNIFRQKELEEWKNILGDLDIGWGPVNNLKEAIKDEHLKYRDMFPEFENEHGNPAPTIGVPIKLSKTPGSLRSQPPTFGKNTKEVLLELGYEKEELQKLLDDMGF